MSETDILNWLELDSYRRVVEACEKSPKPASEIAKIARLTPSGCAETIERLENLRALEHTSGGWKATTTAIKVLNKYFR